MQQYSLRVLQLEERAAIRVPDRLGNPDVESLFRHRVAYPNLIGDAVNCDIRLSGTAARWRYHTAVRQQYGGW